MQAIIYAAGGAIAGASTIATASLGLAAAGFRASGVVAGSAAAVIQSVIGNVVAGSLFAVAQSVSATGAITKALPAVVAGGAVTGVVYWVGRKIL